MSNKVLKDANNQLINIDSSNLSSFDEGVVHKGTSSSRSDETIYGTKNIFGDIQLNEYETEIEGGSVTVYPSIKFDSGIGSIINSNGSIELSGTMARASIGYGINLTASLVSAQSNAIHMRAPGETVPSDWEAGLSFITTDTKYNDSTSQYEYRKGYSKLPTDDGSTSNNYYTLATREWSNSNKVSKTGDTMTGGLALNIGSGYSLSPNLTFVTSNGAGSFYKSEETLYFAHTGVHSYTLTFPMQTGTIATTSDKAKIYAHKLIHDELQYPGYYDIIVYTTKKGPFNISNNSNLKYLIDGSATSTYGTTIKAVLEGNDGRQIPILSAYSNSSAIRLAFAKATSSNTTLETEITSYNYFTNYTSTDEWEVSLDLK